MKINKIYAIGLSIVLSHFGGFQAVVSAQTNNLHPTGLKTLHENIPGLRRAASIIQSSVALPAVVDLSAKFPAVGDQRLLGSCVAFAIAYADKSYQEGLDWGWNLNSTSHIFSPAYIYSQTHFDNTAGGGGSFFSVAFDLIVSQGCTTLDDMPYNGDYYGWQTQPTATQRSHASAHRESTWASLPSGNYNAIKAQLAAGNPVVIGIPVYPDLDYLSPSNPVYDNTNNLDGSPGTNRGNHALCLIGYNDSMNAFEFINSWGTGWGINGYGWIGYNFINSNNIEAYTMTDIIDAPLPPPPVVYININGWTLPAAPVHSQSYSISWSGYVYSSNPGSYVMLYFRAQGSSWVNCGGGGVPPGGGNVTASGGWGASAAGVYEFGVGNGNAMPTSVSATITVY